MPPTNPHNFANQPLGINWPFDSDTDTMLADELRAELHSCWHIWQPYEGLTDTYSYCVKCDTKTYPTKE